MSETELKFAPFNPPIAGYWVLGGNFYITIETKPTDKQIKNTEEMFGWKWKDNAK